MSHKPAHFTQADVARVIRAAKQAGAEEVIVPVGDKYVTIKLTSSTEAKIPLVPQEEIVL